MLFPTASFSFESRIEMFYPVGSIYASVLNTNPADLFGFGTWVAFAVGRAMVGVDPTDADFDAAEKTSGAKTVALTEQQLPVHSHGVIDPGHSHAEQRFPQATGAQSGFTADTSMNGAPVAVSQTTQAATTGITIDNTGGGQAHDNVQPSIAVYLWKRTA